MRVETIEELDEIAQGFILGKFNPLSFKGLNLFDSALVMSLAGLYSCVKIGTLSPMECAKAKLRLFIEYQYFRRRIIDLEKAHDTWIKQTRQYDTERTELSKLIYNKDADPAVIIKKALWLIDTMTGEDILLKMFHKYQNDENFMKLSVDTLIDNDEYFTEQFGNDMPFVPLLEAFFAGAREDGFDEMFRQLDLDELKKLEGKNIPIQKEPEDCKVIARNVRNMFLLPKKP